MRMLAISEPTASEARYSPGDRAGRGLTGADRSELIGFGSIPIGGVGRSRGNWLGMVGGCGAGAEGRAGGRAPVSCKAARRTPGSSFRRSARGRPGSGVDVLGDRG